MRRIVPVFVLVALTLVACGGGSGGGESGGGGQSPPAESSPSVDVAAAEAWTSEWQPGLADYSTAGATLATILLGLAQGQPTDSLTLITTASQVQAANDNLVRAIENAGPPPEYLQGDIDAVLAKLRQEPQTLEALMEACSVAESQDCVTAGDAWTAFSAEILQGFVPIPGTIVNPTPSPQA